MMMAPFHLGACHGVRAMVFAVVLLMEMMVGVRVGMGMRMVGYGLECAREEFLEVNVTELQGI